VWDRLFGSFREEGEPCVYGTRAPLESWDPLWSNLEVYWALARDSWHARSWGDKLRVWFKPPGWRPADVAARFPKPAFDIARVERYDPPMSATAQWVAIGLFAVLLVATSLLLWNAHRMNLPQQALGALGIVAGLWAVGRVSEASAQAPKQVTTTPFPSQGR
jgi:alkylglycerol monooxygenase